MKNGNAPSAEGTKRASRAAAVFLCMAVLALVLLCVSLCVGSYPLTVSEIGAVLTGQRAGSITERVFWELRLPRVLLGLLTGAVLGVSGGVYQMVFESPLASPDLTGVASGASLGAAIAITLGYGGILRVSFAFCGGLSALLLVFLILAAARGMDPYRCILAGVIVSAACDAGLMVLKTAVDREGTLSAIEYWTMGSLGGMTAEKALPAACCAVPALIVLLLCGRQASMLSLGTEQARVMGLSPNLWRGLLLLFSTLCVGAVVSVCGVVGFLGLTAPHIAYLLGGTRGRGFLPLCALTGGVLLLCADLLARTVSAGAELPLSVFTVAFSLPVLAALLLFGGGRDDA